MISNLFFFLFPLVYFSFEILLSLKQQVGFTETFHKLNKWKKKLKKKYNAKQRSGFQKQVLLKGSLFWKSGKASDNGWVISSCQETWFLFWFTTYIDGFSEFILLSDFGLS